jgi:hypothetical protein
MKGSQAIKLGITCGFLLLHTLLWSQTFNKVFPATSYRNSRSLSIDLDPNSDSLVSHGITISGAKSLFRRTISPDGELFTFRTKEFGDTSLYAGIAESYRMEGNTSMCAYGSNYEAIFQKFDNNF